MGEKMTRADAIRAMDDEQLAKFLTEKLYLCPQLQSCLDRYSSGKEPTDDDCVRCVMEFLRGPADE